MIMSASMPLPVGGRRPQPQPRLSLLLSSGEFRPPVYENFENGNLGERRHSESSNRRLRPPKPKPRRRSLLDLPLICARDSSTVENSLLDKSAVSSRSSEDLLSDNNNCEKALAGRLLEENCVVKVKALPAIIYDEDNNNLNNILSNSEVNKCALLAEHKNKLGSLQTNPSSIPLAYCKTNINECIDRGTDNDTVTRIEYLNDCAETRRHNIPELPSVNTTLPLHDTNCNDHHRSSDSTFIGPFQPIKCMPYNSPRLARGPRSLGANQDGVRRNSKISALPRALGRGTLSSSANAFGCADNTKDACVKSKVGGIKSTRDSSFLPTRHERGTTPTMTTHLRSATYKKLEEIANRDADLSDCSSISSNYSGSSGSPSGLRKRPGGASRNVEYRRSAAVPPQLVANLANKFNAIISQNDHVLPTSKSCVVPKATITTSTCIKSSSASTVRSNCRLYGAGRQHKRETTEENIPSPINSGCLSMKAKESTVTKLQVLTNSKDSDSDSSCKSAPTGSRRPSFVRQAVRNYEVSLSSTSSSPEVQRRNSNPDRSDDNPSVSSFTSPALLKKKLAAAAEAQAQRFAADSTFDKYSSKSSVTERKFPTTKSAHVDKALPATEKQISRPAALAKVGSDREGTVVNRIIANPIIYKQTAGNAASSNFSSPKFGVSLKKTVTKTLPELASTTTVSTTTRILSLHRNVYPASTSAALVTKEDQNNDDPARLVLNGQPVSFDSDKINDMVKLNNHDGLVAQNISNSSDCTTDLCQADAIPVTNNSCVVKSKVPKPVEVFSTSAISRGRALFEKRSNTVGGISALDLQEAENIVNGERVDRKPPPLPTTQPRKIKTFGSIRVANTTNKLIPQSTNDCHPTANNGFYLHSKAQSNGVVSSSTPSSVALQHSKIKTDSSATTKSFLHWNFEEKDANSSVSGIVKNDATTSCYVSTNTEKVSHEVLDKEARKENCTSTTQSSHNHSSPKDKETNTNEWQANAFRRGTSNNEKPSLPSDKKLEVGKSNYVPNTSFLWRDNQHPPHSLNLGSIPPPPSSAPPPIPTAAGESPASPRFANHQCNIYDDVVTPMSENGFDEPLYSEAYTSPDFPKENGSATSSPHNVVTYKISRFQREESRNSTRSDPVMYNDSDEGWVDLSDSEIDGLHPKHLSLPLNTKVRVRSRKTGNRRSGLRRSWSQSLRDLAIGGDGKEIPIEANDTRAGGEDYNDFEDFFDSDESDSTNPDHHYEALYEVIHKRTESQESDLTGEWYRTRQSGMQSIESVEAACILEEISDSKESLPTRSSQTIDSANGDKMKQLKRNWSLTKSDIRLELSSRLNKIRVKKTSTSASDVHLETSPTQPADGKKKSWSLRNKFARKKSGPTSPTKRSPSPKKESAHFYVQNYVTQSSTESSSDTISSSSNNAQQPPVRTQSVDSAQGEPNCGGRGSMTSDSPSHSISPSNRGRRVSSGANVIRPKTAPPAPPAYASRMRNGSTSSLESNQVGVQAAQLKHSNSDVQDAIDRARYKSSDSSIQLDEVYIAVLRSKSDSDTESVRSGVRYADIDTTKRFGAVMVSRSNSNVSSGSEMVVIIPKSPKTRSSVASSASTSSSDTYIQMADVDPAVLRRMSDLFHEAVERRSERFNNKTSLAPITRTDSSSSDETDVYLRSNGMSTLSPFEDEPLYQFYNKDVLKRATQLNLLDGSDDDYEVATKPTNQIPGLQSKLSAMDLITPTEGGHRTLWGELPEVVASGVLGKMTSQERTLQEAMFEVITSEASYLKSLNILLNHFMEYRLFKNEFSTDCVLSKREQHVLFSDVLPVKKVSELLLHDLEKRWQESLVITELCDIINDHAQRNFGVYVKYVSNQLYQERTLKALKENNPQFVEALRSLESDPICQNLAMHSFLMLPMQRITRLPLLVDAIFHRLEHGTPEYERCAVSLRTLNKIVQECNEGARKMERLEQMMLLSRQINFRDIKAIPLISASRWLVKEGELIRLIYTESSSMLFGRRCTKQAINLFLFTDLLVLTKKIKGEDSYQVLDHCPRNMVQVCELNAVEYLPAKPPDGCKNLFQLTMLQNHESKTVEIIFSCRKESDRTRWIEAVTPCTSENPEERIYEQWDCPQVQAIHTYIAQQPDELALEESDVVNVLKKVADGWYHGERIRDGVQGWFPANHTVEIISAHVRARNLRQRYRLLQFLEEKRRKEKGSSTHSQN